MTVDNSAGADARFAEEVAQGLRDAGLQIEVELREAAPMNMFDTSVHLVSAGLAIRVSERPDAAGLSAIEQVLRLALSHRPALRRRTRSVPIHLGETPRVLEWVDVFD